MTSSQPVDLSNLGFLDDDDDDGDDDDDVKVQITARTNDADVANSNGNRAHKPKPKGSRGAQQKISSYFPDTSRGTFSPIRSRDGGKLKSKNGARLKPTSPSGSVSSSSLSPSRSPKFARSGVKRSSISSNGGESSTSQSQSKKFGGMSRKDLSKPSKKSHRPEQTPQPSLLSGHGRKENSSSSSRSSLLEAARYAITAKNPGVGIRDRCCTVDLVISQGSVLDYHHRNGAIVNAANEGCLGGGGVDGAISKAGGRALYLDRKALPILKTRQRTSLSVDPDPVRCFTGDAVITGPNTYGTIGTTHVIHAVGPAYYCYDDLKEADELLYWAYRRSLELARDAKLEGVGFSLLSSGVFRGQRSLKSVLKIGIEAIHDFAKDSGHKSGSDDNEFNGVLSVKEVHMCAFSTRELQTLLHAARDLGLVQT